MIHVEKGPFFLWYLEKDPLSNSYMMMQRENAIAKAESQNTDLDKPFISPLAGEGGFSLKARIMIFFLILDVLSCSL